MGTGTLINVNFPAIGPTRSRAARLRQGFRDYGRSNHEPRIRAASVFMVRAAHGRTRGNTDLESIADGM